MKDLHSKLGVVQALAPAVVTATATSAAIDLLGFKSAVAVIATGAIAGDGAFSTKLQHSDTATAGDFVDVPEDEVQGALPAPLTADGVFKQGYLGNRRYLRTVMTKGSGTSIAANIVVLKGHPSDAPVA